MPALRKYPYYPVPHRKLSVNIKVISYKGRPTDEAPEISFGQEGGTLGRSSEDRRNHLTLNDPAKFISRKHATITFENGRYCLTDTSKDGTSIINKNMQLKRDTVELDDGDRLRIGDYELIVHISAEEVPFEFQSPQKAVGASSEEIALYQETVLSQPPGDPIDVISEMSPSSGETESSPLHDPFALPDLEDSPGAPDKLPKNFDFSELIADAEIEDLSPVIDSSESNPEPVGPSFATDNDLDAPPDNGKFELSDGRGHPHAPRAEAAEQIVEEPAIIGSGSPRYIRHQAHLELCRAFMEGAGLKSSSFLRHESAPEFMKTVGGMIREMIDGLVMLLQGRAELKSAFRLSATAIMPDGNNPLKSFKVADEIVDQLLTESRPGFLDAHEAVRDAFTDIKNHQMAMTAGLQSAIINIIERFDPQHFDRQNEGGVAFHRKARSWDAYEQFYARIATETLEEFFGESFAQGYKKQIRKLRKKNG